jgi:formylglycine-generating enzyme required for sulfatase activity
MISDHPVGTMSVLQGEAKYGAVALTQLDGMMLIAGGTFRMGSEDFYPEERPVREVEVGDFWMDEHPVTAAQFRRFVRGYVTLAERPLDPDDYPDADPDLPVPGSLVSRKTPAGCRWTMSAAGGSTFPVPTGRSRAAPGRRSTDATIIPSSRSPTRTPRRMQPGR